VKSSSGVQHQTGMVNGGICFATCDLSIRKKDEKDLSVAGYYVIFPFLERMLHCLVISS
jgi:hypothetical protein